MNDAAEVLLAAEQTGSFAFRDDPPEDIYPLRTVKPYEQRRLPLKRKPPGPRLMKRVRAAFFITRSSHRYL